MKKYYIILSLLITPFISVFAQQIGLSQTLKWLPVSEKSLFTGEQISVLAFEGATYSDDQSIPELFLQVPLPDRVTLSEVSINHFDCDTVSSEELAVLDSKNFSCEESPQLKYQVISSAGERFLNITITPFVSDDQHLFFQKVTAIDLEYTLVAQSLKEEKSDWVENSVLAEGEWYKLAVVEEGVYRINYTDLEQYGLDVASINPKNIHIYGNGNKLLPEYNGTARPDDLTENAIVVVGEEDGAFDPEDYILFYGQPVNPVVFNALSREFSTKINIYSDTIFYFLTANEEAGARIEESGSLGGKVDPERELTTSLSLYTFSPQEINLGNFGQAWFSEPITDVNRRAFETPFQYPVPDGIHQLQIKAAARSLANNYVDIDIDGTPVEDLFISGMTSHAMVNVKMNYGQKRVAFPLEDSAPFEMGLTYNLPLESSIMWLDYFTFNVEEYLIYDGNVLTFNNALITGNSQETACRIKAQTIPEMLWNISDPLNPTFQSFEFQDDSIRFNYDNSAFKQFIAFNADQTKAPASVRRIASQNLHSRYDVDYVIVSHPDFLDQAERIQLYHMEKEGFDVLLTTPEEIYNEFSSGKQDVVAIRSLMRMIYQKRSSSDEPLYLLLVGDASFDYKNRLVGNTNYVPTYESIESRALTNSFAADDFFGLLDEHEGVANDGAIDIAIGRLPVTSAEEAEGVVDKLLRYSNDPETMGSWKNRICLMTDDGDSNTHLKQGEQIAELVDTSFTFLNIIKIPMDAYPQVPTTSGSYSEEGHAAVQNQIEEGVLIFNYNGHGGEKGLTDEGVMEVSDILNMTNIDKTMLFISATCEFSRFDNPELVSGGELMFTNPDGGAVAMMTTVRPTYASSNIVFDRQIFLNFYEDSPYNTFPLGEVFRLAKNGSGNSSNLYSWCFFGDPAMRADFGKNSVNTISINSNELSSIQDTLRPQGAFTLSGEICNSSENVVTDFNGVVEVTIFDKPNIYMTLANDGSSYVTPYEQMDSKLFKGLATVEGGHFTISGVLPANVRQDFGEGKISYFAWTPEGKSATGSLNDIIIGGSSQQSGVDVDGPEIDLFMDYAGFVDGAVVESKSPTLMANLSDISGINYLNIGIGHEIIAVIDGDVQNAVVLNDYYSPQLDDFQKGVVVFPLGVMSEGVHTIELKAWDMNNNFSIEVISFVVSENGEFAVSSCYNRPNPMSNYTEFCFNHNQRDIRGFDMTVEIYDMMGRRIANLNEYVLSNGSSIEPIIWNGTNSGGAPLESGIYPYVISIKKADGSYFRANNKLVICK